MFVLDKHGQPLDPCHPARARRLLASGRAVVHRHTPFVIRLRDRAVADSTIQGVEVGIDPGSKHTGIAVFTERDGIRAGTYSVQLDHRSGRIRDRLRARAAPRRGRRSRNLRYRAPRFSNRARPQGWLAPSLRHRVDTTMSWVERLRRWAPVRAVHVERVAFDTHAMSAGKPLEGVEYQRGTLAGYEVREYLLAKWERRCAYCGKQDAPLNIDHIHPRLVKATGRGTYCRTRTDKYGFPRLRLPRIKTVRGFRTGDLVRANVPIGKKAGVHTGRVAVRSTGTFNITTRHGTARGIGYRHVHLLQRADGYGCTPHSEARLPTTFPPPPKGGGIHAGEM